ncbi:hypothetical protein N3K66_002047 [Trichothecium roseum]|uniref:Uncharacterized protein n=1 Tax=Trichothecium roseum TaxID=47278 RepID=A0ACC0V8G9_9HYPO|nr:hypothetical protein N3K66_002047 [Trichothecium roseum]
MIPKENTAEVFARWGREYNSDIIHVKSLGQPIVVLNSLQAARDLLDKRGANYSDRPRFTLLGVMGWGRTLTFLPFGKLWKMHRKFLQTSFSSTNVRQWHDLQTREARKSVASLVHDPRKPWELCLKRFAVAIVMKVSYGVDITDDSDPHVQIASDAMYATANGGAPANSIVENFPWARYLPHWLIRDWPLLFAREWRWAIEKLHDVPFANAQAQMSYDTGASSLAHTLLNTFNHNERQGLPQEWTLDDIKGATGAVFIAGADTTWATCLIFVLNMVLHPDIQEKAQAQIDEVVGTDRLPDLSDRGSLPYIDWIVNEVYRWSPLSPLGIPHKSISDDTYNGMHIPKVYANAQAMAQDERMYANPRSFSPERFAPKSEGGSGEPLPVAHFGFGRRICVGRFLADSSVWIMAATMLATLNFRKPTNEEGIEYEPDVSFTNGTTCHPRPFKCNIQARSVRTVALVSAGATIQAYF